MTNVIQAQRVTNYGSTPTQEVPYKIRFAVQAMPNLESKFATLQKFYDNVQQDPNDPDNFIVTDKQGNQFVLDNKSVSNYGDYIDFARPGAQAVGATVGTTIGGASGLMTGPGAPIASPAGMAVGAGLGTAAGSEVVELAAKLFGAEIVRTPQELASERMTDFAFGAGGQIIAPPVVNFVGRTIYKSPQAAKEAYKRLKDFADAGVSPTLGQATMNKGIQTVELILGNFPGSSSVITRIAQQAQDDLAKESTRLANNLIGQATPASTITAGKTIKLGIGQHGVNGQTSFLGRFKSRANQLYGQVDKYIPKNTSVDLSKTIAQLEAQVADIPGAEQTSKVFKNQFLNDVLENLQADIAKNGALPYEAVKQLRSTIGNKISEINLVPDVDKAQLKLIYKALSDDLGIVVNQQGKAAANAYNRANKYYNAGITRIDDFLEPLNRVADPDRLVSLLLNSAKEGASRINALKKSLTDDQYQVVVSSIIDKLGRARASQALAEEASGEITQTFGRFSSESFLTNWNSLNSTAKDVIFSGKNLAPLRANLDKIARVSSVIRESGKTFQNPSGTADRIVGQGLLLGAGFGAFLDPTVLVGIPLGIASARVSAKLMQNPAFVKWMAEGTDIATQVGVKGVLEHTSKLGNIMANSDSETRQHIQNYLQMLINFDEKQTEPEKKQQNNNIPKAKIVK